MSEILVQRRIKVRTELGTEKSVTTEKYKFQNFTKNSNELN